MNTDFVGKNNCEEVWSHFSLFIDKRMDANTHVHAHTRAYVRRILKGTENSHPFENNW